jgi:Protein of unknown function (DUF4025)
MEREKEKSTVGDKMYKLEDDNITDALSSGLSETYEQVSDAYMEGTIDGKIERENGPTEDIPKKGYE